MAITASVGVASYPVDSKTKVGLLHLADEAMYLVKNTNRDNVAAANMGILPALTTPAKNAVPVSYCFFNFSFSFDCTSGKTTKAVSYTHLTLPTICSV